MSEVERLELLAEEIRGFVTRIKALDASGSSTKAPAIAGQLHQLKSSVNAAADELVYLTQDPLGYLMGIVAINVSTA
jgi:hypothetical protein